MAQPIPWHRYELCSTEQMEAIDAIDTHVKAALGTRESGGAVLESKQESEAAVARTEVVPEPLRRLHGALDCCNDLSKQLDSCVSLLDSIGSSYGTVASRTTALVHNCEDMLYQQTTLQDLADKVEKYLEPFTDMEDLARKLGVPFSHQQGTSVAATTTRSNLSADELAEITSRLDRVGEFFKAHPEVQSNQMYSQWLTRLRHRAGSLVVLSAKKAIDSAFREASQQLQTTNRHRLDGSLENSPVYSRFRAIAPRLNKVCTILQRSQEISIEESIDVILQHYVTRRSELLSPLVKSFVADKGQEDAAEEDKLHTLPAVVRRVYASLQRLVQMEVMLFQSAFQTDTDQNNDSDSINQELSDLLELLCVQARDGLRPVIIRQTSLEELCRAVLILHEDIGQQFETLRLAVEARRRLQMVVEATVSDAQERLIYLADLRIRSDVEYFEPTPADVSYPEVLQQSARVDALAGNGSADQATATATIGADWYPPLRTTLTVLSRLYNVLELEVFEDIAGHCVGACTAALVRGAEAVKKRSSMLHGNLFLVRHTLLLREQLLPFNIRFTAVERMLDFSSTTTALTKMMANSRALLRFDPTNALLRFAKDGLPKLEQTQVDGKRKMDESVRLACAQLTGNIIQELAGPLSETATKLRAFLDVYPGAPTDIVREKLAEFSPDKMHNLARQSFLRPERLKACLQNITESIDSCMSGFLEALNLYITSSATRSVLVRPIQNQFELVIADVQAAIQAIVSTASEEVGQANAQAYSELDATLSEASNKFQSAIAPSGA